MKVNVQKLIAHVQKAGVNGIVNEVVFGKDMKFQVTDESKSVLSVATAGFEGCDMESIGVFDITLFLKALQYVQSWCDVSVEVDMFVDGNRLVFKKGEHELKYLLSNVKVIVSTVDNPTDVFGKLRNKKGVEILFNHRDIDNVLKAIALIQPEKVVFFTKDKKVKCLVGKESEHNAVISLGDASGDEVSVSVKPDLLSNLLQVLPLEDDVKLELRDDYPIVVTVKGYDLALAPLKSE